MDQKELYTGRARAHAQKTPPHPGEILRSDFLGVFEITPHRLAILIGVPPRRINEIIHGKRGVTIDTALRLEAFFHNPASFWMNLQTEYDLHHARLKSRVPHDAIDAFWQSDEAEFNE